MFRRNKSRLLAMFFVLASAACPGGAASPASGNEMLSQAERDKGMGGLAQNWSWVVEPDASSDLSVCILTQYTENLSHYADITRENHALYARTHGYAYKNFVGRISGEQFWDPGAEHPVRQQGLYWQMVTALEAGLAARRADGESTCDWVMWVDADVLFTDLHRPLPDLMAAEGTPMLSYASEGTGVDVILSREEWEAGQHINAGVVLVRNSPAGNAFLTGVSESFPSYKDESCPEQRAIEDWALSASRSSRKFLWEEAAGGMRSEVAILRQRAMNAFRGWTYDFNAPEALWRWEPGDFIAHFVGPKDAAWPERIELMREVANDVAASAPEVGARGASYPAGPVKRGAGDGAIDVE